jgi:hypothetical protein
MIGSALADFHPSGFDPRDEDDEFDLIAHLRAVEVRVAEGFHNSSLAARMSFLWMDDLMHGYASAPLG